MQLTRNILLTLLSIFISISVFSQSTTDKVSSETYQIGVMVQAVQSALKIRDDKSLQTIRLYGGDSRYYSMIRGWLFQELVGVESQLHASKSTKKAQKHQRHSNFLKKAIISIDHE